MKKLLTALLIAATATAAQAAEVWVRWDGPSTNVNGTACTNIAYRMYAGNSPTNMTTNWLISATNNATLIDVDYIPLYACVAAINNYGQEGAKTPALYLYSGIPAMCKHFGRILFSFDSTNKVIVSVE